MRVLRGETIYECQAVKKRNYELHGRPSEFCTELSISLVPVQPLNRDVTIRVMAYSEEEKVKLSEAFNRILVEGYADLNSFEHSSEL